ncbi:SdpI family protein [Vagococcus luciliae]|nr:SdpI family protein [Vagococcus luciliae]
MIFNFVGMLMTVVGVIYLIFPSRRRENKYGYRTQRARYTDATFKYAQKVAAKILLLIGVTTWLIGFLIKSSGITQFFILEIFLIAIPIISVFYQIERRLELFNDELDREISKTKEEDTHEIIND